MRWWVKEEHPNFEEKFLREQDDAGNVVSVGYQWLEERKALKLFWTLLRLFWIVSGVWLLFAAVYKVPFGMPFFRFAVVAAGAWNLWWFWWCTKHHPYFYRRRAIIFYASGRLSAPYGLARHWLFPTTDAEDLLFDVPIASIQSSNFKQLHPVNIYLADGGRVLVDLQGNRDSSRQLAVQLTRAYEELKAATQRPPSTANVVIN